MHWFRSLSVLYLMRALDAILATRSVGLLCNQGNWFILSLQVFASYCLTEPGEYTKYLQVRI